MLRSPRDLAFDALKVRLGLNPPVFCAALPIEKIAHFLNEYEQKFRGIFTLRAGHRAGANPPRADPTARFPSLDGRGIKGRVVTPTQTLAHQGGGLFVELQELLDPPLADKSCSNEKKTSFKKMLYYILTNNYETQHWMLSQKSVA
jgi:hypothetical protein